MPPRRRGARSDDKSNIERLQWFSKVEMDAFGNEIGDVNIADLDYRMYHINDEMSSPQASEDKKSQVAADYPSEVKDINSSMEKIPSVDDIKRSSKSYEFSSFALSLGEESAARLAQKRGKRLALVDEILKFDLMSDLQPKKWMIKLSSPKIVRSRLICFHGIGESPKQFKRWSVAMEQNDIELFAVNLPGRYRRVRESSQSYLLEIISNFTEALKALRFVNEMGASQPPPTSFFGHQLGALLAYEVARELEHHQLLPVTALIVSNSLSPKQISSNNKEWTKNTVKAGDMTDGQIINKIINDDLKTLESYVMVTARQSFRPLSCPIITIRYANDTTLTRRQMADWSTLSSFGISKKLEYNRSRGSLFGSYLVEGEIRENEANLLLDIVKICNGVQDVSDSRNLDANGSGFNELVLQEVDDKEEWEKELERAENGEDLFDF